MKINFQILIIKLMIKFQKNNIQKMGVIDKIATQKQI